MFPFSLVDLGEDNVTTLKTPDEIEADKRAAGGKETVEASKMATAEMAENAGEEPAKVRNHFQYLSVIFPHIVSQRKSPLVL